MADTLHDIDNNCNNKNIESGSDDDEQDVDVGDE